MTTTNPPAPSANWAYFLDVDGTLIEFAPGPEEISVDQGLLQLLRNLHQQCSGAVAFVSGRGIANLDAHLGLTSFSAAGQHGLEWRFGETPLQRLTPDTTSLRALEKKLKAIRLRYAQLIVEDKGSSIALHYRHAPQLGGYLHRWVRHLVQMAGNDLHVQPGKRVIEIKPKGHDKGSAIQRFMTTAPFAGRMPVFVGDDLTDEHGFAAVNRLGGLSIKVGRGRTEAKYRLRDVSAVRQWLEPLIWTHTRE